MPSERKTVLFIVEGPSDAAALEKIFRTMYRSVRDIEFRFTHGDITSRETINKDNVEKEIITTVQDFMKDKKLIRRDIYQIVQIFDMDGAYISDDDIVPGETNKFVYSLENISCSDINRVKERNKQKREIMDYLLSLYSVNGYSYECYFMSCNLDHALYNIQNLPEDRKQVMADSFYQAFRGKEYLFLNFLKTDVINGVPQNYIDSWEYIRNGRHSLERHTNLHLYFENNPILLQ